MKSTVKKLLKNLPVAKKFYHKYVALQEQCSALDAETWQIAQENIDLRLALKKAEGTPIHVVFLCHRPAIWESLHSVYDAMKQDPDYKVTLIAIPNKKQLPDLGLIHEQYESEGAEEFWKEEGCLNGYNYETGQWLDLQALKPDYVFFQTPYNICRPPQYHSHVISKYARICYISYYGVFYTDEITDECTPLDYMHDLSYYFTQNPMDHAYVENRLKQANAPVGCAVFTGYPRYDRIAEYRSQTCDLWSTADSFKMVWTPRWTTNEGNCHFFDYKDKIVDYCKDDPQLELAFRPHPQAFKEWNATGELPEAEANIYKQNYVNSNMHLDASDNYYPMLYTSDVLITDRSTILLDYFCTGKPIIYCMSNNVHDGLFPELLEAMYCVQTWEEVEAVLTQLRQGIDPLKQIREQLVQESFVPKAEPAGIKISVYLKER